ncbi:hypothetical protein BDV25DRAFT_161273 [Aspergillus avenaceus]|uniref:Zn(2)-C6 fungal-type domain-containing protein n=1 Tax=Aspergillus avenaceus TaxID=36643 RepID=A0A5N6TLP5_ASPAV|nr:hypothetical protein BDV25DRAFT_161273 [Aspergillus avenaceus]
MAVIKIVRSNKRGYTSRKRSLWLPTIAPKGAILKPSINFGLVKDPISRPHIRFPARSRTGCWTCRSRKVKCDERHPNCSQCMRLGHKCDYRPRLSFRDDTQRVIERMSDVKVAGNVVWDREIPLATARGFKDQKSPQTDIAIPDLLPSFAVLTSDEEREKKAQSSIPGTYTVVVIPESFSYPFKTTFETCYKDSIPDPLLGSVQDSQSYKILDTEDPNIVVLKCSPDSKRSLNVDRQSSTQALGPEQHSYQSFTVSESSSTSGFIKYDSVHEDHELTSYEIELLGHFRQVAWIQTIPQGIWLGEDLSGHQLNAGTLEEEAKSCPALFQAILAISTLSIARRGDECRTNSSTHYHRCLTMLQSMRGDGDLSSDGLFIAQFLVVIYEILVTKSNGPSHWSNTMSQLLETTLVRQSTYGHEKYPCVIWWACSIDLYALFSGAGAGEYAKAIVESRIPLEHESVLSFVGSNIPTVHKYHEYDSVGVFMRLFSDTIILATRLGLVTANLRNIRTTFSCFPADLQQRGAELREEFKRLWDTPDIRFWVENQARLPMKSRHILQQVYLLFHTSLLLYYTSFCPKQYIDSRELPGRKIQYHITMILQHGEAMIMQNEEAAPHFVIFPLFLAGVAAGSSGPKVKAWELLSSLEEKEVGSNAAMACYMLQFVYERQLQQARNSGGRFLWVDWVELFAEHGFQLVNYG